MTGAEIAWSKSRCPLKSKTALSFHVSLLGPYYAERSVTLKGMVAVTQRRALDPALGTPGKLLTQL